MRIVIIGGKLQGVEAIYLSRMAEYETILIDKCEDVPGKFLADEFYCYDLCKSNDDFIKIIKSADCVLPAFEDLEALIVLDEICRSMEIPILFDVDAYSLTCSKLKSDQLLGNMGIPSPKYYPFCNGPYIVKPSEGSGSVGVMKIRNESELMKVLERSEQQDLVIQEFLHGPSYSIEIIGANNEYRTYEITEIHMDSDYDCKRVTAPCNITNSQRVEFEQLAIKIAKAIDLKGIMDVEVISHNGVFKVLEIDARFPSQTPTVVYHTSGNNLISELVDIFMHKKFLKAQRRDARYCSYEHYLINECGVHEVGEHIMTCGGPLVIDRYYTSANYMISNFYLKKFPLVATLIFFAESQEEIEKRRNDVHNSFLTLQKSL